MESTQPGTSGGMNTTALTRKELFEHMQRQNLPSFDEKLDFVENYLSSFCEDNDSIKIDLKRKFSHFKSQMKQRWLKAHKKEAIFLKKNASWLEGIFEIPKTTPKKPGRPSKNFLDSSERSKRRKTEEVRSVLKDDVLMHAAQVALNKKGARMASKVLKDITNSPTRAGKYRRAYSSSNEKITPLTPLQALEMFVEADLTRRQYEIIRATNKKHFPCYDILLKAKQECYPSKESLHITATTAERSFQCLVDHTVMRLSMYLEKVLVTLAENEKESLKILCKWGCDGSQQTRYKQKFENQEDSDANIFITSFVPIQIVCGEAGKKIVWQNQTPSSPRFCRPIRFQFCKESTDITKIEISCVEESIKSLTATKVSLNNQEYTYTHIFKMTMVDGKVCNAATNTTSTSQCYICGATSKDFNDITKQNEINPHAIEFGISVLHARIRLFESILHLAYKLPVKKYRKRKTEEEKTLEDQKKKYIQDRFKKETGLLVDMPKSSFGNTNDGNTSRRFFNDPQLAADITGISFDLIKRLKIILETISSGHKINVAKFNEYALDTAKIYINLYGWHPMTPTMHKILIHGAIIIEKALLPIGQLSEEAAEARNKHFRLYRLNFSRKFSREQCNTDIYQRLLLTSDPLISCRRKIKKVNSKSFSPEALELLLSAKPNDNDSYCQTSESENDE